MCLTFISEFLSLRMENIPSETEKNGLENVISKWRWGNYLQENEIYWWTRKLDLTVESFAFRYLIVKS